MADITVIMGVTGAGKSTIGEMLAKSMGCPFLDADDFHPPSNKEKMHRGIPLSDEDRIPWLETLRDALREFLLKGNAVVLGCSALQKHYREILRSSDPDYRPGMYGTCRVKLVLLDAKPEVLTARLKARAAQGTHFMPASLLQSQLELLRIEEDEGIRKVDASQTPQAIVTSILRSGLSNHSHEL
ncbi:gluconokinase isoform X1 [Punica granatum]|nr:gluconokinase isoform X1 [Punica granatum]